MKRTILMLSVLTLSLPSMAQSTKSKVDFVEHKDRIDVLIAGKPFTSYLFGHIVGKPALVSIRTPSGVEVTRRHPLVELEGGTDDHLHHVGLFFAVDGVNGTKFWNRYKVKPHPQIKHTKMTDIAPGNKKGKLAAESQWIDGKGKVLLKENRTMIFLPTEQRNEHAIDFSISLTAVADQVVFDDTEEGVFAIRLADCLREGGSEVVRPGKPLPKESIKGTGMYFSSNGDQTAKQAWGKRARWVALQGVREGKVVGVAILNHPESINYPTYWHVRDYGLFSANPLGQGDFQRQNKYRKNPYKKNPIIPLRLTLKKGQTVHFRFLVIVYEGIRTQEQMEKRFRKFAK
jgi:hypothetical protein